MSPTIIAIAACLTAIAVLPAYANNGGGKGGGASERLVEQQNQELQEEQQQQEEEQIPEAAAPTESILDSLEEPAPAPNDPASQAARDFYTQVVAHLDSTLAHQRQKLKELGEMIADIDHKLAADFTGARTDDKTADDAINSAKQALDSMPKSPKVYAANVTGNASIDLAATTFADTDLLAAGKAIVDFKATAESIKALEAARADLAAAGRAYGAEIK